MVGVGYTMSMLEYKKFHHNQLEQVKYNKNAEKFMYRIKVYSKRNFKDFMLQKSSINVLS